MADERPQPQEPLLERQGVVTDAIIAGAVVGGAAVHGFAEGLGHAVGEKIAHRPAAEPKQEVILPPGVEKPD